MSYLNQNLIDLSLDAAIELERMIKGEDGDKKTVLKLIAILEGEEDANAVGPQGLIRDIRNISVYSSALRSATGEQPKTTDELVSRVIHHLDGFAKSGDVESSNLKSLKEFCLALNKELIAKSRSHRAKSRRFPGHHREARVLL